MRFSPKRKEILESVRSTVNHPTAQEVFEQVRTAMPTISLATVYRDLAQLANHGEIRTIQTGESLRYDGRISDHQHFQCIRCHTLYDLDISLEKFVFELEMKNEHEVIGYELILNGICNNCK